MLRRADVVRELLTCLGLPRRGEDTSRRSTPFVVGLALPILATMLVCAVNDATFLATLVAVVVVSVMWAGVTVLLLRLSGRL